MNSGVIDFIHNPIRDPLCPFRHFGILIDFGMDQLSCFKALVSNEMCFHAMLLMSSASDDLISQRPLSNASRRHLRRVLPLLNGRLSDADAHNDDLLLYVVGILASITVLFGDYHAARMHSTGISKIIQLRGGQGEYGSSSAIQLSIDR